MLSDYDEQKRLWLTYDPDVIAYFEEEHLMLVHDSGLVDALRSDGSGFGHEADAVLSRLVEAVRAVDRSNSQEEIIGSAEMALVRVLATRALALIGDRGDELPD